MSNYDFTKPFSQALIVDNATYEVVEKVGRRSKYRSAVKKLKLVKEAPAVNENWDDELAKFFEPRNHIARIAAYKAAGLYVG